MSVFHYWNQQGNGESLHIFDNYEMFLSVVLRELMEMFCEFL